MPRRDPQEFAQFVADSSGPLSRTAYLMVGDHQLAQDLLQEAYAKTYVAWPRLRDPNKAQAYTRRVITTTAITWFRKRGWNAERVTDTPPDSISGDHGDAVILRTWVWRELQALPPRQRAAIVLRYYADLSESQTATAMGCAVGTVKSQVSAGLATMRQRMRDHVRAEDLLNREQLEAMVTS